MLRMRTVDKLSGTAGGPKFAKVQEDVAVLQSCERRHEILETCIEDLSRKRADGLHGTRTDY